MKRNDRLVKQLAAFLAGPSTTVAHLLIDEVDNAHRRIDELELSIKQLRKDVYGKGHRDE